jgi:hypothetical protein
MNLLIRLRVASLTAFLRCCMASTFSSTVPQDQLDTVNGALLPDSICRSVA